MDSARKGRGTGSSGMKIENSPLMAANRPKPAPRRLDKLLEIDMNSGSTAPLSGRRRDPLYPNRYDRMLLRRTARQGGVLDTLGAMPWARGRKEHLSRALKPFVCHKADKKMIAGTLFHRTRKGELDTDADARDLENAFQELDGESAAEITEEEDDSSDDDHGKRKRKKRNRKSGGGRKSGGAGRQRAKKKRAVHDWSESDSESESESEPASDPEEAESDLDEDIEDSPPVDHGQMLNEPHPEFDLGTASPWGARVSLF